MKTKENNAPKIEFTPGSSTTPLPGVRSTDVNSTKTRGRKSESFSEIVRKRGTDEEVNQ